MLEIITLCVNEVLVFCVDQMMCVHSSRSMFVKWPSIWWSTINQDYCEFWLESFEL